MRIAIVERQEMETGTIVQVMGPVVDVEFPPGNLPEAMTALKTTNAAINDIDCSKMKETINQIILCSNS